MAALIGRNLRRVRDEAGESQAEFTARLRAFGLPWNRSQVAKAERGEREFTFAQILLIAVALRIDVGDLLRGDDPDERYALSRDATASQRFLAEMFDETDPRERHLHVPDLEAPQTRHWDAHGEGKAIVVPGPTEAEEELARTLGTTSRYVARLASALWGHSLFEERERRLAERLGVSEEELLPPAIEVNKMSGGDSMVVVEPYSDFIKRAGGAGSRSLATRRGHITRALLAELRPVVEKALRPDDQPQVVERLEVQHLEFHDADLTITNPEER
jgi:transcriptional regulator with XRE-family HTH domain